MKVLFTTLREKSHFLGMLPFLEAFLRQGHDVAVAAPPDFGERVLATGAKFLPFGHPGDDGLRPIWTRLRSAPVEDVARVAVGELFAGACAKAAIPGLLETIEQWRPALVARESHEFAGLVAAEKLRVPHVRVAICARGAEEDIRSYAAEAVDTHCQALGLPEDPAGNRIRDEPAVTLFPPSFDRAEGVSAPTRSYRTGRAKAPPLPDWWGGRGEPFVYVTLGTVTGGFEMFAAAYRTVLGALADLPVRALLTIGAALPMETLGDVPSNVHVERFVPQDDVIPHAAAVICHGGSGTVLGALAAGVPTVVTPIFADQPHNAARVAAIGAGLAVPQGNVSSDAVRVALRRVLDEESFRVASQGLAREIASLPQIDDVGLDLERLARA